jgi:two-component system chemotaxis response regulator CheB
MVVDDSAVIRGLLIRALERDSEIKVVCSVANGQMALNALARQPVDVIVLDIEMPVMDGLTALPKLLQQQPGVKVIMASTLTRKNADISLKALRAGAADYIAKPSARGDLHAAAGFQQELIGKIKALGATRARRPAASSAGARLATSPAPMPTAAPRPVTLRAPATLPARILAIGSSTGGPQALFRVMGGLKDALNFPVLITQHMPATFTTLMAEHLARITGRPCAEGKDGEPIVPGRIYVAPGGHHMIAGEIDNQRVIRITQDEPENFCRPSVDPMLRSLARLYGSRLLVAILTGMGSDGRKGAEAVVAAGGTVVAQDEETSVVWGMPGAVATHGLCSAVLPIDEVAPYVRKQMMRSAA